MTTLTCLTCEHVFSIGQKWYCHACHEAALAKVKRLKARIRLNTDHLVMILVNANAEMEGDTRTRLENEVEANVVALQEGE